VKRTSLTDAHMSAFDPKRTSPQASWARDLGSLVLFGEIRLRIVIRAVEPPFRARACGKRG
ncbi:MAG: hypothetical protein KAI25_00870, partial [Hyphomicrobiaceae bacterium]|nr:hypothetical protein [Hyphomicrobiaceae bacterium]